MNSTTENTENPTRPRRPGFWLRAIEHRKHALAHEYRKGLGGKAREGISDEDYATTMATLEAMARNLGWTEDDDAPRFGGRPAFGPGFGPQFAPGFGPHRGHRGHGRGHGHGRPERRTGDTPENSPESSRTAETEA